MMMTAALVQNLAVFALEKIGKSSRSLSIGILKNSKKRNDSRAVQSRPPEYNAYRTG